MKGATWTNDYLKLLFQGTAVANIADNAASSPLTNLYLSLHTADPGASGNQATSEATYSGYARQAVARNSNGFTVSNTTVTLAANVNFPQAPTNATDVLMFVGVGTNVSTNGKLLYSGPLGSNLGVGTVDTAGISANTISLGSTNVSVNDRVVFEAPTGGTIPAGLTAGTVYYVESVSGGEITVSNTAGGAEVDITGAGQVLAFKVTPITLGTILVTPQVTTSTTLTEL